MTAVRLAAALLCALCITDAAFSISSTRCCTQLGEKISKSLLKKVKSYDIQRLDGTCYLSAVQLHLKHKTLCISPDNKRVQEWISRQGKKSSGNIRTKKKLPGRKKRQGNLKKKIKKLKRLRA
ncbi:hypothetical protein GDO81_002769 [Engystomops pustulosus]|uniref:Chemokine interleukin-8-like domain-containing protein n=1 Tax=Engystomops pustulosus TaxID=76066 RepID=A0AAV7DNV9_ENGPU|nr:hypothetical protein GDO81_002769 [Engystomops pustulosus]